jgi:hypothetical protein
MFFQYGINGNEKQSGEEESQIWAKQLETYLRPYMERLDAYLDRRVVGNLTATVASIVQTRTDLTLSELGSAICGPEHADAGTQRLQRALHHQGWKAEVIARGALGTSRAEPHADGTARRNPAVHLGEQCARKAGKCYLRRIVRGAFQPGASAGSQPPRRVQSPRHCGEGERI